jgi:hypothetical protein
MLPLVLMIVPLHFPPPEKTATTAWWVVSLVPLTIGASASPRGSTFVAGSLEQALAQIATTPITIPRRRRRIASSWSKGL